LQPPGSKHESTVHALLSSQLSVVLTHSPVAGLQAPVWHVKPVEQFTCTLVHVLMPLHVSTVQLLPSSHDTFWIWQYRPSGPLIPVAH